jgi:hypothetical protein
MTIPLLTEPGVKVTKKPSEETHWSASKLLKGKANIGENGTPREATTSTRIGQQI